MDKKIIMNLNKKKIYYGAALVILVLICVIGMRGLVKERMHQQTKYESVLPGKAAERESDKIRVLIKSNGFEQIVHNEVRCSSQGGLIVSEQENEESGTIIITPDDPRFQNGTIK